MRSKGRCARHVLPTVIILATLVTQVSASGHQILWGRCYAHCLKKYIGHRNTGSDGDAESLKNGIRTCQRDSTCKWCLYVCERSEQDFTDLGSCQRDCQNTRTRPESAARTACSDSCGFVVRSSTTKAGVCTPPENLKGFKSACVDSCHGDNDCPNAEKCCRNGCGNVCTNPYFAEVLPDIPSNITFKLLKTGGVLVKWEVPRPHTGRDVIWPVLYIVRWWCPYTSGAVTSITDKRRTKLQGYPTGIYPGTKCHFMVASVNLHGSRGFSKVSPYIKKFLMPSPPLHLDKGDSTLRDGRVDVTIQWQPPVYTDGLPVHRYQVFWSDSLPRASPNYMRLHMHRRTVSANQHSFVLHSLYPGTIYFVQVRAVVKWKGKNKRGKPASTYIETYAPPQPANPSSFQPNDPKGEKTVIARVTVTQSYLHRSVLKANISWTLKPGKRARKYLIYWKAESCAGQPEHRKTRHRIEKSATTHDQTFTLYNLKHQCEYAVRVHPVSNRGRTGPASVTSFQTLSCHVTQVLAGQPPECDKTEPPGEVQGLYSETTHCVTVVRWAGVSGSRGVDGYDVKWGETGPTRFSATTVIYITTPHQLQLPANQTSVSLGQLPGRRHYTVQVTARSTAGVGQTTILHFTVPKRDTPCDPPRHQGTTTESKARVELTTTTTTTAPRRRSTTAAHTVTSTRRYRIQEKITTEVQCRDCGRGVVTDDDVDGGGGGGDEDRRQADVGSGASSTAITPTTTTVVMAAKDSEGISTTTTSASPTTTTDHSDASVALNVSRSESDGFSNSSLSNTHTDLNNSSQQDAIVTNAVNVHGDRRSVTTASGVGGTGKPRNSAKQMHVAVVFMCVCVFASVRTALDVT